MREGFLCLLLLTAGLAGCLSGTSEEPSTAEPADPPPTEPATESPNRTAAVPAPSLSTGLALIYEATGLWDRVGTVTVVVASNGTEGYLFAGQERVDLVEEMIFSRPWMGRLDRTLNPLDDQGDPYWTLFDWPLEDGKSWLMDDDPELEVTATRGSIPGPDGSREGFAISGSREEAAVRYTYDPEIGYVTTFQEDWQGRRVLDLELVEVRRAEQAIWGQVEGETGTCGDPTASTPPSSPGSRLDVPPEADAVFASAGSIGEGRTVVSPPPGNGSEPWTHEHEPEEQWLYTAFDPIEGSWMLSATGRPDAVQPGTYTCVSAAWASLERIELQRDVQ